MTVYIVNIDGRMAVHDRLESLLEELRALLPEATGPICIQAKEVTKEWVESLPDFEGW